MRPEQDFERLSAYIDGELPPAEVKQLEARLEQDPALRQELDTLRAFVATLQTLPDVKAPRDFTLTPGMIAEQPSPKRPHLLAFPTSPLLAVLATAAALVIVILGLLLISDPTQGTQAPAAIAFQATNMAPTATTDTRIAGDQDQEAMAPTSSESLDTVPQQPELGEGPPAETFRTMPLNATQPAEPDDDAEITMETAPKAAEADAADEAFVPAAPMMDGAAGGGNLADDAAGLQATQPPPTTTATQMPTATATPTVLPTPPPQPDAPPSDFSPWIGWTLVVIGGILLLFAIGIIIRLFWQRQL